VHCARDRLIKPLLSEWDAPGYQTRPQGLCHETARPETDPMPAPANLARLPTRCYLLRAGVGCRKDGR